MLERKERECVEKIQKSLKKIPGDSRRRQGIDADFTSFGCAAHRSKTPSEANAIRSDLHNTRISSPSRSPAFISTTIIVLLVTLLFTTLNSSSSILRCRHQSHTTTAKTQKQRLVTQDGSRFGARTAQEPLLYKPQPPPSRTPDRQTSHRRRSRRPIFCPSIPTVRHDIVYTGQVGPDHAASPLTFPCHDAVSLPSPSDSVRPSRPSLQE